MPATARLTALRLLAQRRLTEAQLHTRLARRGYDEEQIADAVTSCKRDGLVDDRLFAHLYVEGKSVAMGDSRLVGELVKRGISRDAARGTVAAAEISEHDRAVAAYAKMVRIQPAVSYASAARKLERLGFPASLIYRVLRARASADLGDVLAGL